MRVIKKQWLTWSQAYVPYYIAPCPTETLTSFAPESWGRTDGQNPIQIGCYFVMFGKHMQNASFFPIRMITSALLPEGRKKENARIKELLLLFIPISSLFCCPASLYLLCLYPSAAAQLKKAGL